MLGWRLFRHAVLMVLQNWQDAIKILVAPFVLIVLAGFGFVFVVALSGMALDGMLEGLSSGDFDGFDDQLFSSGLFWISFLALWIFVFVSFAGMVVNWHRFVLVEEYPGRVQQRIRPRQGARQIGQPLAPPVNPLPHRLRGACAIALHRRQQFQPHRHSHFRRRRGRRRALV